MAAHARDSGVSVLSVRDGEGALGPTRLRFGPAGASAASAPVIVDLTAVTSIDVQTVGVLLEALAECERRERAFLLLLPTGDDAPVTRAFRRLGLAGLLPVVSSWNEAYRRAGGLAVVPTVVVNAADRRGARDAAGDRARRARDAVRLRVRHLVLAAGS